MITTETQTITRKSWKGESTHTAQVSTLTGTVTAVDRAEVQTEFALDPITIFTYTLTDGERITSRRTPWMVTVDGTLDFVKVGSPISVVTTELSNAGLRLEA